MKEPYLEMTFRKGKALAAYYYLPRQPGEKSTRCQRVGPGLVIDFDRKGRPIGIEITAPGKVTLKDLNRVLDDLGLPQLSASDFAPLQAA